MKRSGNTSTTVAWPSANDRKRVRGSTLAEVAVGMLVFSLFALALLGVMAQSAQLNRRGRELQQVHSLTEGYLEEAIMVARTPAGYLGLAAQALRPCQDSNYVYSMDVTEPNPGLKKICIMVYHHDPHGTSTAIDPARPNSGLALCLSSLVEQP